MVTLMNPTGHNAPDYRGLSSDSKPTATVNGASFIEIDTGELFFFDGENSEWCKVGTGGGSSDEPMTDVIFEGTVTTEDSGYGDYAAQFNTDYDLSSIEDNALCVINYHGHDYMCTVTSTSFASSTHYRLGASPDPETDVVDFSEYPFLITWGISEEQIAPPELITETGGDHYLVWYAPGSDAGILPGDLK